MRSDDGVMHVRKYLSDKYLVYIGIAHDLAKAPGQRVYESFYNVATKVWRKYVEHIAIRLEVFRSGLVMSDDRRVKFFNYITDYLFVCSSIVHDLDEAPG